jgi:hypothetical protein
MDIPCACHRCHGWWLGLLRPSLPERPRVGICGIGPSPPAQPVIGCVQHGIRSKFCQVCHVRYRPQFCASRLPLMAKSRHAAARNRLPLFPQLRTFPRPWLTSAFDPERTFWGFDQQTNLNRKSEYWIPLKGYPSEISTYHLVGCFWVLRVVYQVVNNTCFISGKSGETLRTSVNIK